MGVNAIALTKVRGRGKRRKEALDFSTSCLRWRVAWLRAGGWFLCVRVCPCRGGLREADRELERLVSEITMQMMPFECGPWYLHFQRDTSIKCQHVKLGCFINKKTLAPCLHLNTITLAHTHTNAHAHPNPHTNTYHGWPWRGKDTHSVRHALFKNLSSLAFSM